MFADLEYGVLILLGFVVLMFVVSGVILARRNGDGEEHDLEHLEHGTIDPKSKP